MPEVVVIGAGAGGLAAAIDLAAAGFRVTVVEAADEAGGKIGRRLVRGIEVDTGPSVLTMPDVVRDLLGDAAPDLVEHDVVFEYLWPDGTAFPVHFELERTIASAGVVFGGRAAAELAAFQKYAERIWTEAAPAFVYGDAPGVSTMRAMGLRMVTALSRIDPMRTMREGIEAHVKNRHLRDVLWRYATYNGSDPRSAPATLNCIAHVELAMGAYGVAGGMYMLVRALVAAAEKLGVEFRFDEPVEQLVVRGRRPLEVVTSNQTYAPDAVVANADVHHVFTDLLAPRPSYEELPPSMSGWTAVARMRRREGAAPHTVLFPTDYHREFEDIFSDGTAPSEPTVYLCAQERAHGRAGWDDAGPVFLMVNAPAAVDIDVPALEDRLLGRLREAGLWSSADEIVWRRTPAELARRFPGSRGALYGAASNSRFAAFRRPANRSDVPSLYFASGSAHPGGGVPLALLSGRAAARAVIEDLMPRG